MPGTRCAVVTRDAGACKACQSVACSARRLACLAQERKREEMIILAKRQEVHQQRIDAAGCQDAI